MKENSTTDKEENYQKPDQQSICQNGNDKQKKHM